ncbi:MAG: flippase-like domain-containing protein [Luteimonas sp.]|nr:flippase-like domain-containing protein [Luteimonas sp.]
MKRWVRWIGMALAIAGSIAFVGYVLSSLNIEDLRAHLSVRTVMAIILAMLLYSLTVPISAYAWQRLLASLGHRQPFVPLNAILLTTQAGKYLPGNVGQHLGRIGLALAQGIPAPVLVASMAYEVLLLMLAGVLVGLACSALSEPGLALLLQGRGAALATAIAVAVAGLGAIPLLGRYLPRLVARIARARDFAAEPLRAPGWTTPPLLIAIYTLAYLVIGAATSLLAVGLFPEARLDFALLTAAFAIAWVVGFVTPGAPAGIGVREALLMLMLGGSMGAAETSLLILALRIVTTLGDMLCFAAGLAQMAWLRRKP